MRATPTAFFLASLLLAACSGDIYLRDGVTDGDTFFLSPAAAASEDPATRSWVSYSLTRSTCQLGLDAPDPARANSYQCELIARRHLLESWREQGIQAPGETEDHYLDSLQSVAAAGYLAEYVAWYYGETGWELPDTLDLRGFRSWRKKHLHGHRPQTRITGSWGYAGQLAHE